MKTLNPPATGSKSSAANAPSDSSQLADLSDRSHLGIEEFLRSLKAGVQCWEAAGSILVNLRKASPNIFKTICQHAPWLTADILWCFHRIGEGKLYPQVLLLRKCPAESELLNCEYDVQRRLCNEPVEVVVSLKNNEPVIEKRWVREFGKETTKLVFANGRVRDKASQIAKLKADAIPSAKVYTPKPEPEEKSTAFNPVNIPKKLVTIGLFEVSWLADGTPFLQTYQGKGPPMNSQVITVLDKAPGKTVIEFKEWKAV